MRRTFAFVIPLSLGAALSTPCAASVADQAIDFDTQIVPIFTLAGCNAGSCHGSASGRGGFKLSLWGSSPEADYNAIVREMESRRINLARPEQSLVLLKPTEGVDHEGGYKIRRGSDAEQVLLRWIEQGAQRPLRRRLVELVVTAAAASPDSPGSSVQLMATARFDDGHTADVTSWTAWTPTDDAAVSVKRNGQATIRRGGQHVVLGRFLHEVQAVTLTTPLRHEPVDLSVSPVHNFIDEHIYAKLGQLGLAPSPQTSDPAFLRRVSLDLTGRLPTPVEVRAFAADGRADKRQRLIDALLNSDAFVEFWTYKQAEHLQIDSKRLGVEGARAFHEWLRRQVAGNAPLDRMAQALVKATGDSHADGAANFSRVPGEARAHAEYVSRVWLGVRLGCANCHNHPLDRWTQDDYHGFAAIFAPLDRGRVVRVRQRGEVTHPVTGKPAPPRLPGERFLPRDGALLDEAAQWVTDPDNPFFARSAVNRIWKHMMGRGLIEPVDDLRATNPPTHPELMDALTSDFAAHGYDVARLIRLICNSAAYQRSAEASAENAVDDRFYARALMRPLDAQVLADAVAQATGVWDIYGGHPIGTRATSLFDSRVPSKALDVLGRCAREGPCAPAATAGDIARTLHLINGDLINRKIASSTSTLAQWIERGLAGEPLLEELYLHTLSRFPTDDERTQWLAQTNGGRDRQALEDLFWALLACREFQTNH